MLGAALGLRARRLAFEIDDEKIVSAQQHLSQMVVAMVADFESAGFSRRATFDPLQQAIPLVEEYCRVCPNVFRQGMREPGGYCKRLIELGANLALPMFEIVRGDGFRCKRR